jgi:hypothetical protein
VIAERTRPITGGVPGTWTAWALVAAPIPSTLVDAKGDLIVATANDTPARLAVGTDTHVLTADSSQATGVKWAAPSGGGAATITPFVAAPASTQWISTPDSSTAAAPGTPPLNTLALAPIYLRRGVSLSEVGVKTWATASAGGIIRVGIWASDANDKPTGSPLITATIATDGGNGNMFQTFASTAVPAGLVFVGFVQQVASATMGLLEMGAPAHVATHGGWQLNLDGGAGGYVRPDAYNVTGVSGALGTLTGATFVPAQYIPRFSVKVA